jgi:C1A family cysteine protease
MKLQLLLIFLSIVNGISVVNGTYCQRCLRGSFDVGRYVTGFYSNNDDFHLSEFTKFMEKFNKTYTTFKEFKTRFTIFKQNFMEILEHNLNFTHTFSMGVNQFTDLTADEFRQNYVGTRRYDVHSKNYEVGSYGCKTFLSNAVGTPSSIDWRSKNAVSSVKDQGQCGSCWTFSSTGAVEGAWAISTGKLLNLSEQELVDCATGFSYGSHGCNGGQMEGAFKYVSENGLCSLSSYPYTSGETKTEGSCQTCSPVAHISSCSDVKPNDQVSLKAAVAQQPVSIAIEADTRYFQSYSSGVLTSTSCGTNLDHGVLIVGYGTENNVDYWLIKNSWSDSWGENGYIKIARSSSTNDSGICGVAMQPSFPNV